MSHSDITFNIEVFHSSSPDPTTVGLTNYIIEHANDGPKWYEIGAPAFRALQEEGKTSWASPPKLAHAKDIHLPSREADRTIRCRVLQPQDTDSKGVFLYIHGGGHVLGHCDWQDTFLSHLANSTSLTLISPEYRLAPENPHPDGNDDCYDVATSLISDPRFGELKFIGGESAGATLAVLTLLHLLDTQPKYRLSGMVLNYGVFDLSLLPAASSWETPLVIDTIGVEKYFEAYLPGKNAEQRRDPGISPIYHPIFNLPGSKRGEERKKKVALPLALFLTGTKDLVVDDMVLMSFRWAVAGGETRVRFLEAAPHSFLLFPERFGIVGQGREIIVDFLRENI